MKRRKVFVMMVLALAVIFISIDAKAQQGIYSLWPPDKVPASPEDLAKPFVAGASVRNKWSMVQAGPSSWDFTTMNKSLNLVRQSGKQAIIRFTCGAVSPNWVLDRCQYLLTSTGERVPLPWDPQYLKYLEKFLAKLGERYGSHAAVAAVEITGGGYRGEMFLNPPGESLDWVGAGYTADLMIATWKKIVDMWVSYFPNKPLCLNVCPTIPGDITVATALVDYIRQKYGGTRIAFQNNGLSGLSTNLRNIDKILLQTSSWGRVGYQMVGSQNFLPQSVGDYMVAFQKAVDVGASYLEVYRCDVIDPTLADELEWLSIHLRQ